MHQTLSCCLALREPWPGKEGVGSWGTESWWRGDLPREPPQGDMGNTFICLPSDRALGRKGVTADLDISFSRVSHHSLARRQTSLKPRADCHLSMPKPAACPEIRKRRGHGRPWTSHLQSVLSAGSEPMQLTSLGSGGRFRDQPHPGAGPYPLSDL